MGETLSIGLQVCVHPDAVWRYWNCQSSLLSFHMCILRVVFVCMCCSELLQWLIKKKRWECILTVSLKMLTTALRWIFLTVLQRLKMISWLFMCVFVCHRGVVHPAAVWWVTGVVGQAATRVSQLPHAERVAKKGVSASHYCSELWQGEGELKHTIVPFKSFPFISMSVFTSKLLTCTIYLDY